MPRTLMNSLEEDVMAQPPVAEASLLRTLRTIEGRVERLGTPIAVTLILLFSVWGWFAERQVRLWFDELLEVTVATAPTIPQGLSLLEGGIDNNPPLSHLITRWSISLLGDSDVAARLPAFVGFVGMLICLYIYSSRWLTRSYGVLALLVMMCSPIRDYAWSARPYGLVLGLCGLALLFHRQATEGGFRRAGLAGLAICTAGLAFTHYYAILAIVPFLLVDAIRAWERKKVDWALVFVTVLPPTITLAALRPIWEPQHKGLAHYWGQGNLLSFNTGYTFLALDPMIYVFALLMITVVLSVSHRSGRVAYTQTARPQVPIQEAYLGACFLILPILGAFSAQFVTHAYSARYFVVTALGFALCLCYAVRFFSSLIPGLAVIVMLALGLGFSREFMRAISHPAEQLSEGAALRSGNLPLVFDNPLDYLQVYHYSPELRERMWVIADPPASLKYRNYDTDDKGMLELAARGGAQAITLSAAAKRWNHFTLVPNSRDYVWALQCVLESGAEVRVEKAFRSGYPNQGDANFGFDVTVTPESLGPITACDPGGNQ